MKKKFTANESVMIAQYQGLNVNELDALRKELRAKGILFKITKNRITKIALKETPKKDLEKYLGYEKYNKLFQKILLIIKKCKNAYKGLLCNETRFNENQMFQLFGLDFVVDNKSLVYRKLVIMIC